MRGIQLFFGLSVYPEETSNKSMWCDNWFGREPIERVGLTKYLSPQDDQSQHWVPLP